MLGEGKWNVIHFNFGLHDVRYVTQDGKFTMPRARYPPARPADSRFHPISTKRTSAPSSPAEKDERETHLVFHDAGARGLGRPLQG